MVCTIRPKIFILNALKLKLLCLSFLYLGSPLVDIAFFLYTSANSEDLIKQEYDFIEFYYKCICFLGLVDYTFQECLNDYQHAKEFVFVRLVSTNPSSFNSNKKSNKNIEILLNHLVMTIFQV